MASEIKAELLKIPPVTRFLCASQLVVSLPVMLQILSPYQVVFVWQLVIKRYEVGLTVISLTSTYTEQHIRFGGRLQVSFWVVRF